MSENLISELVKRLDAKTIHELRQLGRALGIPHPADGKKKQLLDEIIALASGQKDIEPQTKRGAPPKSQEYDRQLAADVLMCREIFLTKNLPHHNDNPKEIFVANGDCGTVDFIAGGILEYDGEAWFLRTTGCRENFASDVFVNARFVKTYNLREGDFVEGRCKRVSTDEMAGLASVLKVNGTSPDIGTRPEFDSLLPVFADKKLSVSRGPADKVGRIIDLLAPIGAGQRAFVVSPPGCGKTRLLKDIAAGIMKNNRVKLVIVLIDVSPEDAADFTQSFANADVFTSPFDAGTSAHIKTMRLALEYCKRQTELCNDVVLVINDITRLTRAFNYFSAKATTGLDYSAVDSVKRVLAAARNTQRGGSLTVISALCVGAGDVIDDAAYSALKNVCNVKIALSQALARSRIYPPFDFAETYSAADERILNDKEMQASVKLREKQADEIFAFLDGTEDNEQLAEALLR